MLDRIKKVIQNIKTFESINEIYGEGVAQDALLEIAISINRKRFGKYMKYNDSGKREEALTLREIVELRSIINSYGKKFKRIDYKGE